MSRSSPLFVALALFVGSASPLAAQEWTRFRGPNGTGMSDAATVPTSWTEEDFNWRIELVGGGHSSPVIWGDKIFLTSADETALKRYALCYSAADGRELWRREYDLALHDRHRFNSFASATPAVDEERVYIAWSTPESYTLLALDHRGQDLWERDLGPYTSQHSGGTSPIVYEEMIVLGNDQDGPSSLVAVDRRTGETLWQRERTGSIVAYSTPCVRQPDGAPAELIFNSKSHGITAINPLNGDVVWEAPGVFDKRSCSSPVVASGLVIGSCGSGAGTSNYLVAVSPGSPGQPSTARLAYKVEQCAPYVPTPLAKGRLLFLWSDQSAVVTCLDAPTGEVYWQEKIGGNFFGSPVCVTDRLYCMSDAGDVEVLAASTEFEHLATNPVGEFSHATPAVANGTMYLRTYSHLISVGGSGTAAASAR